VCSFVLAHPDEECVTGVIYADARKNKIPALVPQMRLARRHTLPPPIPLLGIMLPAHQRGIVQECSTAFAVGTYMVNGEIVPAKFGIAIGVRTHTICHCVPHNPALLGCEPSLGVLLGKQTAQNIAENLYSLSALTDIVRHL
jgi:hypothetical protein